jgi:hypothetical protein
MTLAKIHDAVVNAFPTASPEEHGAAMAAVILRMNHEQAVKNDAATIAPTEAPAKPEFDWDGPITDGQLRRITSKHGDKGAPKGIEKWTARRAHRYYAKMTGKAPVH